SYGNAGWMTPCFAMPLPMPGMFFKSLRWLLNPEGPLYIKPSLSPDLMSWLILFLRAMNEKQARAAIEALVKLSQLSLQEYEKLAVEFPEIQFEKRGLLMVSHTAQGLKAAVESMNLVSNHQVSGRKMTADEVRSFEPSLRGNLQGGVYFPDEAQAEPLRVVQALAFKARALGVRILEEAELFRVETDQGQVRSLATSHGTLRASQYVLATGSWSKDLARQLRLSIPILGGKGYSLIVPPLSVQPKVPMMLVERKIAITPRKDSLRIAGTLELVDQDFSVTHSRVQSIIKGAREFLPVPEDLQIQELWRGLRPCTPDGVPLIGFSRKLSNLMLACGHQMLGLQSGLGTGVLVADLMTKGSSPWDRAVYSPDRF
ncbi:MAG: amino acid dehydrogenase, partial [Bdellovibrio sp. CG10_big_fil_rev_8_21_14_0_10_47_8]